MPRTSSDFNISAIDTIVNDIMNNSNSSFYTVHKQSETSGTCAERNSAWSWVRASMKPRNPFDSPAVVTAKASCPLCATLVFVPAAPLSGIAANPV